MHAKLIDMWVDLEDFGTVNPAIITVVKWLEWQSFAVWLTTEPPEVADKFHAGSLSAKRGVFTQALALANAKAKKAKDKPADPIIVHPDVRKMLLTAKAYAEGGRALISYSSMLLEK